LQIPRKKGLLLAAHAMFGAARTFLETEIHPGVLRDHSITKKGIPLAGLTSLEKSGFRGAMMQARPLLFEPYQILHIEAPQEFMGEISKLISNKRGQLLDMQQEGMLVIAKAKMPVGELFGWSSELRSATGGRGSSSLVDQMFEKLPEELQQKIVNSIKQRKGLTDAQLGA